MNQFVNRARQVHESRSTQAAHLDFSGEPDTDLVDYYRPVNAEELKVLAARTANAVWLVLDPESEAKDDDVAMAIAALAEALNEAGVKWTSGR